MSLVKWQEMHELSTHIERVASRRQARLYGLSFEEALRQVMELAAYKSGEIGIRGLLESRRQQSEKVAGALLAKRQLASTKRQHQLAMKKIDALRWNAWFDGSACPNPGRCGIGAVLVAPDGRRWECSREIGYGNSSEAEYHALIAALDLVIASGCQDVVVMGDSRVVIDDLQASSYQVSQRLTLLRQEALAKIAQITNINLRWIPRNRNIEADALSRSVSMLRETQ